MQPFINYFFTIIFNFESIKYEMYDMHAFSF